MSQLRSTVPRPLGEPDHITIHPLIDWRISETARPLIETKCGDVIDAEPRLSTLIPWRSHERMTIAACQGESCKCCTQGGLRPTSGEPFTVDSTPLSRDAQAQFNPLGWEAVCHLAQPVVENTGLTVIDGYHHRDTAIVSIEIDLANVYRKHHRATVDCDVSARQSARQTHLSRKARVIAEPTHFPARLQGRDASHRTRNLDTHLTHGCIQHFRHFSRVHSECRAQVISSDRAFVPNLESTRCTLEEAAS
jgi:hypothetical protein